MAGYKFVRQEPIGPYIADFVCREHLIIVELDGSQHAESLHDAVRDTYLASIGYRVLRFWNAEVFAALESVLDTILATIEERAHSPLPAGGERVTSADRPT
jgi:very-short-patch-repair endonuclease